MSMTSKAFEKALAKLNMDDLASTLTDSLYSQLADLGHKQLSYWSSTGWRVECENCGFAASGNSVGARGKGAADAMAAVHLGEVRDRTD
jgi:hypothetical protein